MLCRGRGDRLAQTDHREGAEEACLGMGEEAGRSRDLRLPEGRGSRRGPSSSRWKYFHGQDTALPFPLRSPPWTGRSSREVNQLVLNISRVPS